MLRDHYRYALELQREDNTALGQFATTPDMVPAAEWARFEALREGKSFATQAGTVTTFEPVWDPARGEPYVGSIRVILSANGYGETSCEIPIQYFKAAAQQASQSLVEKKVLKAGERFEYSVLAFAGANAPPPRRGPAFTVEEVPTPLALKPASLAEFLGRAAAFGTQEDTDPYVFVPQEVIDEASTMTRKAEANEIGGLLLGRVCQDPDRRTLFIEVSTMIPAKHTLSETTKLTFTAETWAAANAAIQLRGGSDQLIGWMHSHPGNKYWCSEKCSVEARRLCPFGKSFFSSEDVLFQRTVFPMAYAVALLITNTVDGLQYATFGWRRGIVAQRAFHILITNNQTLAEVKNAEAALIGGNHEKTCP